MAVLPAADPSHLRRQLGQISERLTSLSGGESPAAALHEQWQQQWEMQSEQLADRLKILNRKLQELSAEKNPPALRVMRDDR